MAPGQFVQVLVHDPAVTPNERILIDRMSRDKLAQHSSFVRALLVNNPLPNNEDFRMIMLPRGNVAGLKKVVLAIYYNNGREDLVVRGFSNLSIAAKCYIWQACMLLGLEPKSAIDRVTAHLSGQIARTWITTATVAAVNEVFLAHRDDPVSGKPWKNLVNQYASDLVQGKYSQERQKALDLELLKYPELGQAITAREEELRLEAQQHEATIAQNEARKANGEPSKREQKRQQNNEKWLWEAARKAINGEGEYRNELQPYINALKAGRGPK